MDMLKVMTSADITAALAGTRDRGGAEREIKNFAASGEVYLDVKSIPTFSAGKVDSVYNSFNANVKKLTAAAIAEATARGEDSTFPELKVLKMKDADTVLLVNIDAHAEQVAAELSTNGNGNAPTESE